MTAFFLASVAAFWCQVTPPAGSYDSGRAIAHGCRRDLQRAIAFDMVSSRSIVRRFQYDLAEGRTVWVDAEHASTAEDGTQADGWDKQDALGFVDRMAAREDGAIMARIILFRKGYEAVCSGRFTGFSPAFWSRRRPGSDVSHPTRIVAVAMTSHPHIKELTLKPTNVEVIDDPPDPRRKDK